MAAPGSKVADKPKDTGLMVDFYLKRAVDYAVRSAGPRVRGCNRASAIVQFEATWV
jgi:hypothetical protein